jgi:hypothetical protein
MMKFSDALLSNEQIRATKGGYLPTGSTVIGVISPPTRGSGDGASHCGYISWWSGGPTWTATQCPPATTPGGYVG